MITVTVNSIPVPAIVRHNVTYVEVDAAEKAIGVLTQSNDLPSTDPFYDSNPNQWATVTGDHTGYLNPLNQKLYEPWYQIAHSIHAHKLPNHKGWEFDIFKNVYAATPFVMPADNIQFATDVGTPQVVTWDLDTGAFEALINQQTAATLNLPTTGQPITVNGIGGQQTDYQTLIPQLQFGDTVLTNIPVVVDPNPADNGTFPNLFGWRFFEDNGYSLYIDRHNFTLDIAK